MGGPLEWGPEDRRKLDAWLSEQRYRCPGCGTYEWETNPDMGGDPHLYQAHAITCPACKSADAVAADLRRSEQNKDGMRTRLYHSLELQQLEALEALRAAAPG